MSQAKARLEARAGRLAANSIGRTLTIRKGATRFTGKIVECEFDGWRPTGDYANVQFNVILEGPTGLRFKATVERLPR